MDIVLPAPDVLEPGVVVTLRPLDAGRGCLFRRGDAPTFQRFHFLTQFCLAQGRLQITDPSLVFGERRVDADQVDALVVETTEQFEVVGDVQVPVEGVSVGHRNSSKDFS